MFAGVARYVCRPQVVVSLEAEVAAAVASRMCAPAAAAKVAISPDALPPAASALPRALEAICGRDAKLQRMLQRHLDASPCMLTKGRGIDLDTMLRRDHAMPLSDFLTLSTVNRKILLLDSLKRHDADTDAVGAATTTEGSSALSGARRHGLILERGRSILLDLHGKK